MGATETATCRAVVDKHRLSASLVFKADADPIALNHEELLRVLAEAKVKITGGVEKRVQKLATILKAGKLPPDPVQIAKGRPADDGDNGCFELAADLAQQSSEEEDEQVNFYEYHKIIAVAEGQILGKIYPPQPPKPGEDVLGQIIKPQPKNREVVVGNNVRMENDGVTVVATCDGKVDHDTYQIAVSDMLLVPGDVDFSSGNIDSASNVLIRGTVLDRFSVKSGKSVEVGGSIESAEVHAGGDVLVRGGICGKDKGKVTCGGELRAKFCDSIIIEAEGDIHIAKQAINCTIETNGSLFIKTGSLVGGNVHTRNGGELKVLGSDGGAPTHIGIGMNLEALKRVAEIDEKVASFGKTATQIRTTIKPLMDSLRRLSPEQREKATELMFQADDLDAQARDLAEEKKDLLKQTASLDGGNLIVSGKICERVSMTVNNYSLRFDNEVKGPVKIEKRKIENVTEIVYVNQLTGSMHIMPARKIDPAELLKEEPEGPT